MFFRIIAAKVLEYLISLGYRKIGEAQYTQPMLTTVRLPREEMGKFTIDLLLDRLSGGHKAIVRTELEGNLMIRESCTLVENTNQLEYYI